VKPSGPLKRKTPLRNKIPQPKSLSHEWPEASREIKRTYKKTSTPIRALREAVLRRDGGCVARSIVPDIRCVGSLQVHHLWRRSQGGPNEDWNLKSVCAAHHEWIHRNVRQAKLLDLIRMPGQTEAVDKHG
jgi:5-methylcytosine-specific restriction endonuclease McrA